VRTECTSAHREPAAVGVGVFIGCTPFYGFHLLICRATASVLGLNSPHVYLAASLSNPVFAPLLIFSELQTGALMRRGVFQSLTLAAVRTTDVWSLGLDYLLGVVAVGVALGTIAAAATYAATRTPSGDPMLAAIIQRASDRYLATSITAWEFARGKMRGDPVYRNALCGGLLPSGRALVDIGCGQGLMLALLAEARHSSFPQFDRLIGIERRPRIARLARTALGADAEILEQDARSIGTESYSAVLLFDVLHLMSPSDQEAVVRTMAAALEPGGIILVRDGDASAGWRFAAVRIGNRLKAFSSGIWRQKFHFRTKLGWIECYARLGLDTDVRPMGEGTPFANVLFRLTVRAARLPPTSNSHEL
jgi:SAM-dependent methyltransferase